MLREFPRGVEVLIKKAAVDPAFKKILLEKRAGAAEAISLKLEAAEAAMLEAVPEAQLESIIANTKVSPSLRPAFLGYAAAAMLAALATKGPADGANNLEFKTYGVDAEMPPKAETAAMNENKPSTEFGTISGLVTDEQGNPIEGALVVTKGSNRFATSDVDGYYKIWGIPEGIYEVKASFINHTEQKRPDIKILPGINTVLSFVLNRIDTGTYRSEDGPRITGIRPDLP